MFRLVPYQNRMLLRLDLPSKTEEPILNTTGKKFEAIIVATKGVIIRKQSLRNSKMLAFLMNGTGIVGEAIEIANAHEAWLKVTKPVIGWCPIVDTGRIYISISHSA